MTRSGKAKGTAKREADVKTHIGQAEAKPFVKWPGGKRLLVKEITKKFPEKIKRYWEPFVGGGAVFFSLAGRAERAILSDSNKELITAYDAIKYEVDGLIKRLRVHEQKHYKNSNYYYEVRGQNPETDLEKAARFIYLNKTCFNGLYRVNGQGTFNVPKGDYKNPKICDEPNLTATNLRLQNTDLHSCSFEEKVQPSTGDLVYCDPPYHDTFTNYQAGGFNEEAQERLRDAAVKWNESGAVVVLSNNKTKFILDLYGKNSLFNIREVQGRRAINRDGKGRGAVTELIIETTRRDSKAEN